MSNPTGNQLLGHTFIQGRWFDPRQVEEALEVASHAILARARVLEPNDPDVALLLRTLVAKLDPEILMQAPQVRKSRT